MHIVTQDGPPCVLALCRVHKPLLARCSGDDRAMAVRQSWYHGQRSPGFTHQMVLEVEKDQD